MSRRRDSFHGLPWEKTSVLRGHTKHGRGRRFQVEMPRVDRVLEQESIGMKEEPTATWPDGRVP